MIELSIEAGRELSEAVEQAAGRGEVREAIEGIYRQVQVEIDRRRPKCDASGRCCHFEAYGHRLFVTTLELAAFVGAYGLREDRRTEVRPPGDEGRLRLTVVDAGAGGCPFQVEKLCGVHGIRPFGCRIFFCDPSAEAWQAGQYERFHGQLKEKHESLGVPYFYVEWRWR